MGRVRHAAPESWCAPLIGRSRVAYLIESVQKGLNGTVTVGGEDRFDDGYSPCVQIATFLDPRSRAPVIGFESVSNTLHPKDPRVAPLEIESLHRLGFSAVGRRGAVTPSVWTATVPRPEDADGFSSELARIALATLTAVHGYPPEGVWADVTAR